MTGTRTKTKEIRIEDIRPNPDNPRDEAGDVTELADQIEAEGQLYDALVIPDPQNPGKVLLLDGYRRWVGMRARGYETMTCRILHLAPDEDPTVYAVVVGLITSSGKPLNAMERARAYNKLIKKGLTATEVARRLGKKVSTITRDLELMDLAPKTQTAIVEGRLSVTDGHRIVRSVRQDTRKRKGQKPAGTVWEEPWFGAHWHLAQRALTMCRGLEHRSQRLQWKDGPCGRCVEMTIRMDQDEIRRVDVQSAGLKVTFQSPPNSSTDVTP